MGGKRKIYKYCVQPKEFVIDIHGHRYGAGHIVEVYKKQYDELTVTQNTEGEDGNKKTTK